MTDLTLMEWEFVAARSRLMSIVRERRAQLVLWIAIFGWSAALFALVRSYFHGFRFGRYDLGNMVQAVSSTAEGRPLEMTMGTGEQVSRLAAHADPILVVLAPLWFFAPSPLTLAAVQICACALGALPVFWLGQRHLESKAAALLLAFAYLAYPWLAWTALDAIHPVTLAIPLFLYAIWFLDSHRLWAFGICAVLAASTGELMGLPLVGLGLWYSLARRRRRAGLVIATAGFAWTLLAVKVIIPSFQGGDSPFYSYYEAVGGSPEGVIRALFTDPDTIVNAVSSEADFFYTLALLAPLAGAFLLAPWLAASALPQLAANSLTSIASTTDPRGHHLAGVIPFLIAGSVLGISRLPGARRPQAAVAILTLCIGFSLAFGPWPGVPSRGLEWPYGIPSTDSVRGLHASISLIPDDAPVAATNRAGSHLSERRYFYSIPRIGNARWIVIDLRDVWVPLPPSGKVRATWGRKDPLLLKRFKQRIDRRPEWRKISEVGGVLVYHRLSG